MDEHQIEEKEESLGKRIRKELFDYVKIFVECFVVVYLITAFIAKPIQVDGSSMYPTLEDEEIGITNVLGIKIGDPIRFDVVIVDNEERDEYWVKRVIGLPNETIECRQGVIYINGNVIEQTFLDTPYVKDIEKQQPFTSDFGPVVLGDDEYFLMGDNRVRSEDSRVHGPFKRDDIVGKDVFVLYPFNKIKLIRNGA